ncbi:MAG TPA: TonB-dependent receptor plug domain-containing protein, partial [Chitinophaga sp.]|nr:TonB-dependent receptor plug domain-containing protein [Chitinophaga sp.]
MKKLYAFWALLLLACMHTSAQQPELRTYQGTVTDSTGLPIPGATIAVRNGSKGVVTKNDGSFTLQASPGTIVVVTSVGFQPRDVVLGTETRLQVTITSQASNLTDIVVVGYGTQRKASVTGAVSTLKSDDLVRTPSTTTSAALVGKMPGITARAADSRPGNGTSIQIRNLGNPLFVIDGVPYTGSTSATAFGFTTGSGQDIFNNLGLDDIENITILKDASASIYGLRASNGV